MNARLIACAVVTSLLGVSPVMAAGQKPPGTKSAANAASKPTLDVAPAPAEADPLTPAESSGPLLAPGATSAEKPAQPAIEADPIVTEVRKRLALDRSRGPDHAALVQFYADGDGKPVWTSKDGLSARGKLAIAEIGKAADWGLDRQAFVLPPPPAEQASADALADAEIKIGIAALTYARHARGGRIDPTSLTRLLDRKPRLYEPKSLLQAFAATETVDVYLRGLHPKHPQFEKLRQVWLASQAKPAAGASDTKASDIKIPAGPRIKPGAQHPHVALIRQRLGVTAEPGKDAVYDDGLQKALMAYQSEHGQEPTGIIGNDTRVALNGTARHTPSENLQRILVNMEQWRWMPDDLGQFYVMDSVTEQMSRVFDQNGKMLFNEKIVVGKVNTPTPMFSANMQFVIFHPSWGVPDGIKMNELAPLLRQTSNNSGFLFFGGGGPSASSVLAGVGGLQASINGRPVNPDSVNWSSIDIRGVSFTQPPGAKNVLGIVKFRFPNKHDVYMHDTPERNLFGSGVRAFSHGCMRVQNPVRLAEVLLAHDKGWSSDKVQTYVRSGGEIKLSTEIPVHVTYFTAHVDDTGKVQYFPDIYGLDSRIATALAGRQVNIVTSSLKVEKAEKSEAAADAASEATPKRERSNDPGVRAERQLRPRARVARAQPSSSGGFNPFSGLFGN